MSPSSISYKLVAPQTAVVHVGKALDFRTATTFKALCHQQLALGVRRFILDFSCTGSLDATGLGAIYAMQRQVTTQGGAVAVAAPTVPVERAMRTAQGLRALAQFATVFAATVALR